ncbi:MAG: HpaII family restriction endonuclease [Paraprevotella sp.]|nr:HpaII family restriction endonuclease [Paraprevotella sp.]
MMTATRREWNELYTFFTLLSQGTLAVGNAEGVADGPTLPIAYVQRVEHDGKRKYYIDGDQIRIVGEQVNEKFPREDFETVAGMILQTLKASSEAEVEAPQGVEEFLDALKIFNLEAQTEDRTDLHIAFYTEQAPAEGFRIQSMLCGLTPLLDGGRTANLKFEQTGVRFSGPAVNKINYTENPDDVVEIARRMLYIESLGGILKYSDVADKIFRSNLLMLDTNLPRILACMVRSLHLDNISKVAQLTEVLEEKNPLKLKDELVRKHGFYRHKVKQFLLALALGLRPAKMYTGKESAVTGFIMVDGAGRLMVYRKADRDTFADYLFTHTRLEKGSPEKDKYGYLERENRLYYLKLNLKVGFVKR